MAADGHLGMTALSRVTLASAGFSCYILLLLLVLLLLLLYAAFKLISLISNLHEYMKVNGRIEFGPSLCKSIH